MANQNFDFRMEDPNSEHYQEGTIQITDEELKDSDFTDAKKLAEFYLTERQQKAADYRLSTDEIQALCQEVYPTDADARDALAEKLINEGIKMDGFLDLPGNLRAAIATHHQALPYKIISLKKAK